MQHLVLDFDNPVQAFRERIPRLAAQNRVSTVVGTFAALVEFRAQQEAHMAAGPMEEAGRRFLAMYGQDGARRYLREECGVLAADPVWEILGPALESHRKVCRMSLANPATMRAAALAAMWFYKCHPIAQVYIRIPGKEIRKEFWREFRGIAKAHPDTFQEEQDSTFGRLLFQHVQRRMDSFVTSSLPKQAFSENTLFVFGPGADWAHESSRKIYLLNP